MSSWKEKEEAYRLPPTRVFLKATMIQSCGHLNHDSMKRIRAATLNAFMEAATKEGMTNTWTMELSTKTPKDFDVLLARRQMVLPEPATSVDARPTEAAEGTAIGSATDPSSSSEASQRTRHGT